MRKKTKNRHGGFGLQVLLLMLLLLVTGTTNIQAQSYITDVIVLGCGISTIAADDDENDSDWCTLQGFKIGRKPTQPGVYIQHGKKVVINQVK